MESPEAGYPGLRYVLLHSFAHALMRQLTLECGYTAASIRERIYSLSPEHEHGPMAGILLYTSAPDSEGTLGGLVGLGKPERPDVQVQGAATKPIAAETQRRSGVKQIGHPDRRKEDQGATVDDSVAGVGFHRIKRKRARAVLIQRARATQNTVEADIVRRAVESGAVK